MSSEAVSSYATTAVVHARGLSKRYTLGTGTASYGRLTESLSDGMSSLFSRQKRRKKSRAPEYVWALRDVSFDVGEGEVVGIIGPNGAGKTTLLKMLSRITEPTEGEARIRGRVGALLEVGAGFHPELTGRENILLNGAVLGMRRAEILRRFDEIVAFSEVERFIETPVKRYSSGMLVRLAFAVAAHLDPEVLVVDEVLAVGDAAFQKKCLGRMGEVATSGRTVLFVSHNMGAVRSLCQRALVLDKGAIVFDGSAADAVTAYMSEVGRIEGGGEIHWTPRDPSRPHTKEISLSRLRLVAPSGRSQSVFDTDTPIRVEITYEVTAPVRGARFGLAVQTPEGELVFQTTDHNIRPEAETPGRYRSSATIPARFLNRRSYSIVVTFDIPGFRVVLPPAEYLSFTVAGVGYQGSDFPEQWPGTVCPSIDWTLERLPSADEKSSDSGGPDTAEALN
jgi:lipopolysaccharide transport system ATP-binding protein